MSGTVTVTCSHDDLAVIRKAIADVCSGFSDDYWSQCDRDHRFPTDFYRRIAEGGWIGIAIPEEFGGAGRGITEAAAILEEISASGACMNGCSAIHMSVFGLHPVVLHGSADMKRRYLPRIATGELHAVVTSVEADSTVEVHSSCVDQNGRTTASAHSRIRLMTSNTK